MKCINSMLLKISNVSLVSANFNPDYHMSMQTAHVYTQMYLSIVK